MSDSGDDRRLHISFDDVPDEPAPPAPPADAEDSVEVVLRPRPAPGAGATPASPAPPSTSLQPPAAAPPPPPAGLPLAPPAAPGGMAAPPAGTMLAPEQASFEADGERFEYASWLSRVGAALIDWLVLFAGTLVMLIVLGALLSSGIGAGSAFGAFILVWLAITLVQMAYAPTFMARGAPHNGQTLGKQLVGLRVRRTDGRPMWFWFGVLRNVVVAGLLFGMLGSFLFGIPLLLDLLWPLWDSKRRCLHDIVVSTVVTREP
jgi:uncharacterized RDD family membrane protein YckC